MKLNSDNHWSYTWTDLAKFEDGKELDYSIKETEIPDGYTGKVEIDKDGHFILTNTHQVKSIEPTEASEPEEPRKPKKQVSQINSSTYQRIHKPVTLVSS